MSRPETIAVLILTYNRYDSVQKTLASVLRQHGVNYHIYIFDNHSELPLYDIVNGNKRITYIRHNHNMGFARNYYYAAEFILRRRHPFIFLLGDDDLLAHPRALGDLYRLISSDRRIAVVRGGSATYVGSVSNLTRIYLHVPEPDTKHMDQIYKAIQYDIMFYSGILFRTQYFRLPGKRTYDMVSPFLTPLFMLLKRYKFAYLPRRVTILAQVRHNQLATQIYNERISNETGVSTALHYVGYPQWRYRHTYELFNYKLYSHRPKLVKQYYKKLMTELKGWEQIAAIIIYHSPRILLGTGKYLFDLFISIRTKRWIKKYHSYVLHEITLQL